MAFPNQAAWATTLTAAGLVLAVNVVILNNQWSTSATLAEHTVKLERISTDNTANLKNSNENFDNLDRSLKRIERQIFASSTNVGNLLAEARLPINTDVSILYMAGHILAFPATEEALKDLQGKNFTSVMVTPAIQGWAPDPDTARIVENIVNSAQNKQNSFQEVWGNGGNTPN